MPQRGRCLTVPESTTGFRLNSYFSSSKWRNTCRTGSYHATYARAYRTTMEHRYQGKMFDEETILNELNECLREVSLPQWLVGWLVAMHGGVLSTS